MEITKESFLRAEDPKNRDAMLFDMLNSISTKLDKSNKIENRVTVCEKKIAVIRGAWIAVSVAMSGMIAWMKLE